MRNVLNGNMDFKPVVDRLPFLLRSGETNQFIILLKALRDVRNYLIFHDMSRIKIVKSLISISIIISSSNFYPTDWKTKQSTSIRWSRRSWKSNWCCWKVWLEASFWILEGNTKTIWKYSRDYWWCWWILLISNSELYTHIKLYSLHLM